MKLKLHLEIIMIGIFLGAAGAGFSLGYNTNYDEFNLKYISDSIGIFGVALIFISGYMKAKKIDQLFDKSMD